MGLARPGSLPALGPAASGKSAPPRRAKRREVSSSASLPSLTKADPRAIVATGPKVPMSEMCEFGDPRAAMRVIADMEESLGAQRFAQVASRSFAIHACVRAGRAQLLRHMLRRGFNPNLSAKDGRTPLYCAVELVRHGTSTAQLQHPDREDVLDILLTAKANPNARIAATRETALDAAARYNNEEVVGRLLSAGAEPTVKTKASSRDLQKRLPRYRRPIQEKESELSRLLRKRQTDVQALLELFKEGEATDIEGDGWAIRVVSAEGNFATLRVQLGQAAFYLSCQQVPMVVTSDCGMVLFAER